MAEFKQPGGRIQVTATKKIKYHELIAVGGIVAVATHSAETGETISCEAEGVFAVEKAKDNVTQGAKLYLGSDGKLTTTAGSNTYAGIAWSDAGTSAEFVEIKINA